MMETISRETTDLGAAGSRESSLGCCTSGGLRAGTGCTREVCLGLLDLVGRDVLLALGRLTCVLEAVALELRFPLVIIVKWFNF